MPIETAVTTTVTCDNPNCPGNDLDPSTVIGWLEVTHQVNGDPPVPTAQLVFCSYSCLSATADSAAKNAGPLSNQPPS